MARVLKITIASTPYGYVHNGLPNFIMTITDDEIMYAPEIMPNRWGLIPISLLKVDTPFREDEIMHEMMPTNMENKDAYIREVKYRRMKNDRIAELEMLLQKQADERK